MAAAKKEPAAPGEAAFADAVRLLRSMATALRKAVARLNKAGPGEGDPNDFAKAIDQYQKSLRIVLALEGALVKRSGTNGGLAGAVLDLVAARREIDARLARLRLQLGDERISERIE